MIFLDTCAIIWDAQDQSKLTDRANSAIAKADDDNAQEMGSTRDGVKSLILDTKNTQ